MGRTLCGRVALVKTLGMHRYLSAISMAAVVVGNSSSAIIEVRPPAPLR